MRKKTAKQIVSDALKILIALLLIVITLYPFWHVVMYSFSDSKAAMSGGIFILPRGFSLDSWKMLLATKQIFIAFRNSIGKTLVGTVFAIVISMLTAYPLSVRELKGRTFLQGMIFFTMLFNGGMIPTYLLIKDLGLLDTFWVYVIPGAMNVYNMFILRNFFQAIPISLSESAMLDGANHFQILSNIVIPLAKPAIATQVMFYSVSFWNSYMDGVLYVNKQKLQLLQVYLRQIINSVGAAGVGFSTEEMINKATVTEESMKMTVIAISVIPVAVLYLCLQKYFIKGTMVGSVKG